jgi:hypothetical protein
MSGKEVSSKSKEIIERMNSISRHKIIDNLDMPKEIK